MPYLISPRHKRLSSGRAALYQDLADWGTYAGEVQAQQQQHNMSLTDKILSILDKGIAALPSIHPIRQTTAVLMTKPGVMTAPAPSDSGMRYAAPQAVMQQGFGGGSLLTPLLLVGGGVLAYKLLKRRKRK